MADLVRGETLSFERVKAAGPGDAVVTSFLSPSCPVKAPTGEVMREKNAEGCLSRHTLMLIW